MLALDEQSLIAKCVQQLERPIGGLGNAVDIEEPEPAMKGDGGKIVFLKNVGESPEAVGLDEVGGFHDGLSYERRRVGIILQSKASIRAAIPLGVIDGQPPGTPAGILRPFP